MKKLLTAALLLITSTLAAIPAGSAQPVGGDNLTIGTGNPRGNVVDHPVIEHPAEFIVETIPGANPNDPDIREAIEQSQAKVLAASQHGNREPAKPNPQLPEVDGANSGGGISVVFNSAWPTPLNVQAVLIAAANEWDQVLQTNPQGPVEVEVFWAPLGNSSALGYAGPESTFSSDFFPTLDSYPAALANTFFGGDLNGPAAPELQVVLNADPEINWYIGTEGTPNDQQFDLFTVALHELGHGLGFAGSARQAGDGSLSLRAPPASFDQQASYQNVPVPALASLQPALTSDILKIDISDTETFWLHAPSSWRQGSSYSHFDEWSYYDGPGALMTPYVGHAETTRTLDAATIGLMQQIGWPIVPRAVTPVIFDSGVTNFSATVIWNRNFEAAGLPPTNYRVEALRNGTFLEKSEVVPGTRTYQALTGLVPGMDYTIRVTPIGANGDGIPATTSVTLSGTVPATITTPLDGQISRLYQAYFLRSPDQAGSTYWQGQRAQGASLADVSNAFASSQEFVDRYGSLSDAQFISLIYQNVLGRQPDAEGLAYWQQSLATGQSRGSVMIGFADSLEFISQTLTSAPHSSTEGSVRRLYQAFFLRQPDVAGLTYWVHEAENGRSLTDIASQFATSPEFVERYGSLSDQAFVELIYSNVLGRPADSEGLSFWLGQLGAGQSRGAVIVGFSESSEFILRTGTIP